MTLVVAVNGIPVDAASVVAGVEIRHGAPGGVGVLAGEPSACALAMLPAAAAAVPIGAALTITDTGRHGPRFAGTVYGRNVDTTDPDRVLTVIRAHSVTARLGRVPVGDVPWPAEPDGTRVARILTAAGTALGGPIPADVDPGTVDVLPRDVDRQPAGDLADAVAQSALGIVVDGRDGRVRYLDARHAEAEPPALELNAGTIPAGAPVDESTERLWNTVTVVWGPDPGDGSPRPRVVVTDAASVDRFGVYAVTVDSALNSAGDAADVGTQLLTRWSNPIPVLPGVDLDSRVTPDALAAVDVGAVVIVTGLPAPAPPRVASVVVGWREVWTDTDTWTASLILTDAAAFGRALRWVDVDPGETWATIDPTLTWDTLGDYGLPGYAAGRWVDVPASLRWNDVDPDLSWSEWPSTNSPAAVAA